MLALQTFGESDTTENVYAHSVRPLVLSALAGDGARCTCFAYGQTGSGKTFTMSGIQNLAAHDLFAGLGSMPSSARPTVHMAFYEIYGGRCFDVLHNRAKVAIREDGRGNVQAVGLRHKVADSEHELLALIEAGNEARTTRATAMNDTSSRSHAICEIEVRDGDSTRVLAKLSLIDLAGSERAADSRHHDRNRRLEGAEINKSLLALKECIRALGTRASHVPFRASKLTQILKDSFTAASARVTMIATLSPAASAADHTQNTLRYADRIKEKDASEMPSQPAAGGAGAAYAGLGGPSSVAITEAPMPDWAAAAAAGVGSKAGGASDARAGRAGSGSGSRAQSGRAVSESSSKMADEADDGSHVAAAAPRRGRDRLPPSGARKGSGQRGGGKAHSARSASTSPGRSDDGCPSPASPSRADYNLLAATMAAEAREDAASSGAAEGKEDELAATAAAWVDLNMCLDKVVEAEEALLEAHMGSIQANAEWLTEEGQLLSSVQGRDVVDYDIEGYTARLEQVLTARLSNTKVLLGQVQEYRRLLKMEEDMSARIPHSS